MITTNNSGLVTYSNTASDVLSTAYQLNSNFAQATMSSLADGGFSFKNTSNELVKVSIDGTETKISGWVGSAGSSGSNLSGPNYGYNLKQEVLTSSQMTSLGISAPTFSLMLQGIKSV